jgi:hypothetical protein
MGAVEESSGRCSASEPCRGGRRALRVFASSLVLALPVLAGVAFGQKDVVGWGAYVFDSSWNSLPDAVLRATGDQSFALHTDGSVDGWGDNWAYAICIPPPLPAGVDYVDVTGEDFFSAGLRSDGSIVVWGLCAGGQCNVPSLPAGLTYVGLATGGQKGTDSYDFVAALRSDGTIVAWGDNFVGQCNVPPLPAGLTYVKVDAGGAFALALRSDGSLIGWGQNSFGQCNPPALPAGLTYVDVAVGRNHVLAQRSDGTLIAWGDNGVGQCNVPSLPAGLSYTRFDTNAWFNPPSSAMARSSHGETIRTVSATCLPCQPEAPTSTSRPAATTPWRDAAMGDSPHGA